MSSNIIGSLPKESDNPSEKVKALVFTIDTVVKEGNTNMVYKRGKQNLMW